MTHCYQLNINEREEISLGVAQNFSKNYIALSLGRLCKTRLQYISLPQRTYQLRH